MGHLLRVSLKRMVKLVSSITALIAVLLPGVAWSGESRNADQSQILPLSLLRLQETGELAKCNDEVAAMAELGLIEGTFAGCVSTHQNSDWLIDNLQYTPDPNGYGGFIDIHHKPGHYDNGGGNGPNPKATGQEGIEGIDSSLI